MNKYLLALTCGMLALIPGLLVAQTEATGTEQDPPTVAEQLKDIKQEHRQMALELTRSYRAAETDQEREAIVQQRRQQELEISQRAIQLSRECDDEELVIATLAWLTRYNKGDGQNAAANELLKNHLDSKALTNWTQAINRTRTPSAQTVAWLDTLIEKSPHREVQADATFRLLQFLKKLAETSPVGRARLAETMGEAGENFMAQWDPETCQTKVEQLAAVCVEKYADVKVDREAIGKQAQAILNLANLKIGKIAPDILGEDLDGVAFQLSDYRGKIVMLDFWGDW